MTQSRNLLSVGLAHSDDVLLRSLVRLIAGRTRERWDHAAEDGAIDLLIAAHHALPVSPRIGAATLIARVADGEAAAAPLTLARPFRARALIELLDDVSERLRSGAVARPVIVHDGPTLAEQLYRLAADSDSDRWVRFDLDGEPLLHARSASGPFVADSIEAVIASASRRDAVQTLMPPDAGAIAAARPMAPLLWSIGLAWRSGPCPVAPPGARVAVSRWPDFSRFPHRAEHMRLMARIARIPSTAAELVADAGITTEDAHGFINALLLSRCGHVQAGAPAHRITAAPAVPLPVMAAASQRGLLVRIRARLGL